MLKSEREHTKAPEQMEPPKSSQKWGAKSSQNQLKRKKTQSKLEHPNTQKVSGSTQKLKTTSGAPKRPQNKKKN